MKQFYLLVVVLCLSITTIYSQGRGMRGEGRPQIPDGKALVVGKVIDKATQDAIQYANISIYDAQKKKIITGGITDEEGRFKIEIPYGKYYALVDFMGFANKKTKEFEASENNRFVRIGKIVLQANANMVGVVEVTAEKELLETKIDRKTFNISKDVSMKSKNALEALEELPSVSVDIDGNISLRGNGNVRILINDRPIVVTAENQAAVLEQIQASNIESIDLITNPSAKYNPEGMGGIINIQLKKSQPAGKNFSATVSSDFYRQHSLNLSAGIRTKKINLYATYGFRKNHFQMERIFNQENIFEDTSFYKNSVALGDRYRGSHMGTVGFDYQWNKQNSIGLEALLSYGNRGKLMPFLYYNLDKNLDSISSSKRNSEEFSNQLKVDYQLRYKHKFAKKKHYLEFTAFYTQNASDAEANYFETEIFPELGDTLDLKNTAKQQKNNIYHYKLNYQYPISSKSTLEAGLDGELRDINDKIDVNDFNFTTQLYESNSLLASSFQYYDQVHAVYGLYRYALSKWTYQLGLRLEYKNYRFDLKDASFSLKERYNYYPTLHIQYQVSEASSWSASYSKRVNRPSIWNLNPIRNYTDAYHYRVGNPNLLPENIHATEISYSKRWEKIRIFPAVFYKYVDQVITHIKMRDSNNVDMVTFKNLNYRSSAGTELILNYSPKKWLDINASANFNYSKIEGEGLSNEDWGWSAKLMSFIKLPYQTRFQISYHYNGERIVPQGYILPMQWLDLGLKKSFGKRKWVLGIRASDILRTRAFNIRVETDQYNSDLHFRRIMPYCIVSLTYQVGKKQKRNYKPSYNSGGGENIDM